MVTVMNMSTGKTIEDEFGSFENEVMNAEWLARPALELGLQTVEHHTDRAVAETEVDEFLRRLYGSL